MFGVADQLAAKAKFRQIDRRNIYRTLAGDRMDVGRTEFAPFDCDPQVRARSSLPLRRAVRPMKPLPVSC